LVIGGGGGCGSSDSWILVGIVTVLLCGSVSSLPPLFNLRGETFCGTFLLLSIVCTLESMLSF
jgi:hypothetical protein